MAATPGSAGLAKHGTYPIEKAREAIAEVLDGERRALLERQLARMVAGDRCTR